MAIEAYTGLPGDGKTYEVVKSVIVPAIARGQRVVTNIRGLNAEKIGQHLSLPTGRVSQLIKTFEMDDAYSPDFYPSEGKDDGVLEWGAFNIVDEAHFVWGTGTKFNDRAKYFLRQHRHEQADERSTQIVAITQSVDDLTSYVRNVVAVTTRCVKQRAYGRNRTYWCRKFNGATEEEGRMLNQNVYQYTAPYIHMYSTQRGKRVDEKGVDTRLVIWRNRKVQLSFLAIGVTVVVCIYTAFTMQSRTMAALHLGKRPGVNVAGAQGGGACRLKVVSHVIRQGFGEQFFVFQNGGLRAVPSNSVRGPAFQQYSSAC